MENEIVLTVILKSNNSDGLNSALGCLCAKQTEHPIEIRAVVAAGNAAATHIVSVYQKSNSNFHFQKVKESEVKQAISLETEKALGRYILIADTRCKFLDTGVSELINYLSALNCDVVFFDTLKEAWLFPFARAKGLSAEFTIEAFLEQNSRMEFPPEGAAFRKEILQRCIAHSDIFSEENAVSPLAFCHTGYYAKTTVLRTVSDTAKSDTLTKIKGARAFIDFFGEVRGLLSDSKYAFLFRYARKKVLSAYDAYALTGEGREAIENFDAALRERNLPLYLSAGEHSLLHYVEKLRKNGFRLTKLQQLASRIQTELKKQF